MIIFIKSYIEFNSLTKVGLADCPVDHGELESRPQEEEEGEKPVDAQRLLAGDCIKGAAKGAGRKTASSKISHRHRSLFGVTLA